MQRRTVLRRLGAGAGAVGLAESAGASPETIRWRFADGHAEELPLRAFDAHPETPDLSALRTDARLAPECCCCKTVPENCADCSPCPCEETTLQTTFALARR